MARARAERALESRPAGETAVVSNAGGRGVAHRMGCSSSARLVPPSATHKGGSRSSSLTASSQPLVSFTPDARWASLDASRPATPLRRSMSIKHVPRELVHILARFVPAAVPLLVRVDRASWARFVDDPFIWIEAVRFAQHRFKGRALLRRYASTLLARWPFLALRVPELVTDHAEYFALEGRLLVYGMDKLVRAIELDSRKQLAVLPFDEALRELALSPTGSLLACMGVFRCVLFLLACVCVGGGSGRARRVTLMRNRPAFGCTIAPRGCG